MRLLFALALLPGTAFADAGCMVHTTCWDNACEKVDGGIEMSLIENGEGWDLAWRQGYMFLMQGAPDDPNGTFALYEPYADGQTSILTLYPSGEMVLTTHRLIDGRPQVATFYGDCAGDGG